MERRLCAEGLPHIFLHQGELHCAREHTVISTVLGSCVSVCLWDPVGLAGGMNHFVLPGETDRSARYASGAIDALVDRMVSVGCQPGRIAAKVFGGGAVLPTSGPADAIGARNATAALARLAGWGIPVIAQDTGGECGRFLRFDTATGTVLMRRLPKGCAA